MPQIRSSTKREANNIPENLPSERPPERTAPKRVAPKRAASERTTAKRPAAKRDRSRKPQTSLLNLPLEVRIMIYQHILIKEEPILITSPIDTLPTKRGRKVRKAALPTKKERKVQKGAAALLEVSKEWRHDASQYFYEVNRFTAALPLPHRPSSTMKSSTQANAHGFECFLKRVPQYYMTLIRHINILVPLSIFDTLSNDCEEPWCQTGRRFFIPYKTTTDIQTMVAVLIKRFPGLRKVCFDFVDAGEGLIPQSKSVFSARILSTRKSLYNSFHNVYGLEHLKGLLCVLNYQECYHFCLHHVSEALDNIVEELQDVLDLYNTYVAEENYR